MSDDLQVLGHVTALAQLRRAIDQDTLHHAILLEGPRGVGKRRLATWVAMRANCIGDGDRPCGRCQMCRQIPQGLHPDVIALEPDTTRAAQAIPVGSVREVIRQAQFHRYGARHRFVIVDPAEAMQEPAANALLKTLEEPPPGTGFLVVTHNAKALLPTILSRCQRIRLGAVPVDQIRDWLVARGVDDADSVARLAQGCPGRALELAGEGLATRRALRDELIGALRSNLGAMYKYTQKLTSGGRQAWLARVGALVEILEEMLRDASIVATGASVPLLNEDARADVERWAQLLWPEGVERCASAVQEFRDDLEVYVSGRTALDALLLTVQRELMSRSSS